MKKINNKGFMLAEIIIVSAIIMVTIVGVYKGFSNTHKIYAIRNSYYDSNVLYSLKTFENFLVDSMALNKVSSGAYEIKRDGSTPAGLFVNDQYTKKSLENFFDTYAISKLHLVKYDSTNIANFTKDSYTGAESDIKDFVKFYMKNLERPCYGNENDKKCTQKFDYIIIARTGVAAGNDKRQVAEKYGALRIK